MTSSMHTTNPELLSWILNTEIVPECNVETKEKKKQENLRHTYLFENSNIYLLRVSERKGRVKEDKKEIKTETKKKKEKEEEECNKRNTGQKFPWTKEWCKSSDLKTPRSLKHE